MASKNGVKTEQLLAASSGRFYRLPKALTIRFVREMFKEQLRDMQAKRVGGAEIKVAVGKGAAKFTYSFQCFKVHPLVSFLKKSTLRETRYGFLLLIERDGHLVVFSRGASGVDQLLTPVTSSIPRHELTHAWGKDARYLKLGTRRMTIGRQELKGAAYEADDLESALPPAVAARSIPQSIRLHVAGESTVAITPSTGRVQKAGEKVGLKKLIDFIDELLAELNTKPVSVFLSAFPTPLELANLPKNVEPTGLLFDSAKLLDYLTDPETACTLKHAKDAPLLLLSALAPVLDVKPDPADLGKLLATHGAVQLARLKRLTGSYGLIAEVAKGWWLEDNADGTKIPLERWFNDNDAFSLSFSEPEYFYTLGSLYQRGGFSGEAKLVQSLLRAHAPLDGANSEKGPFKTYTLATKNFAADSIFRVLETTLDGDREHLCCTDLNDEWADYLGIGTSDVTFFHCKDGSPTSGASDFQIVVAQALKNLSRVKFRKDEIQTKLDAYTKAPDWTTTTCIPRLVKGAQGWPGVIAAATGMAGNPHCVWRVALVVTALSFKQFEVEMKLPNPKPYFIQLVWLLSAFASGCRERDAQPIIYCRS